MVAGADIETVALNARRHALLATGNFTRTVAPHHEHARCTSMPQKNPESDQKRQRIASRTKESLQSSTSRGYSMSPANPSPLSETGGRQDPMATSTAVNPVLRLATDGNLSPAGGGKGMRKHRVERLAA